ncbi:MAG: hypothetical protein PHI53_00425 [Candidatus Pacebacteria bacterium]|nr:hypothetical protein [Candidatus Paceibacterota bacterium]
MQEKKGWCEMTATVTSFVLKLAPNFNPAEFVGKDWKVIERDEREDGINELDWSTVDFETCLKEGESSITGEERLKHLKVGGKVRLGGRAFLSLWNDYQEKEEKKASVLEQLYKTKGITFIDFPGLVLQPPFSRRSVLYLYRCGGDLFPWIDGWLVDDWLVGSLSAVSQVSSS